MIFMLQVISCTIISSQAFVNSRRHAVSFYPLHLIFQICSVLFTHTHKLNLQLSYLSAFVTPILSSNFHFIMSSSAYFFLFSLQRNTLKLMFEWRHVLYWSGKGTQRKYKTNIYCHTESSFLSNCQRQTDYECTLDVVAIAVLKQEFYTFFKRNCFGIWMLKTHSPII
jgi:hypothetical protein